MHISSHGQYTTQGLMTSDDVEEYLDDTDQNVTLVDLADSPDWFTFPEACPICGTTEESHDTVTVEQASGEIIDCDVR